MHRRAISAAAVVVLVATACSPSPSLTPAPTSRVTEPPGPTASPAASPTAAPSPTEAVVDLPPELRDRAWAQLDYESGHLDAGLLGQPATFSRVLGAGYLTTVSVAGRYLLLEDHPRIEVVDVVTGETKGRLDLAELAEPGFEDEAEPVEILRIDPERGLAYYLSSGSEGVVLRRFGLDGSNVARLVTLAPERTVEDWRYSVGYGFVIGRDGNVVATSCSPPASTVRPDHRCRLYVIPPDATQAGKPRIVPGTSAVPCDLVAAGRDYLVATIDSHCHGYSAGPPPALEPLYVLSLGNLSVRLVDRDWAAPGFRGRGVIEVEGTPWLVGPYGPVTLITPDPYLPYGQAAWLDLGAEGGFARVSTVIDWEGEPEHQVDALWDVYGDWLLLQPLGLDYATCRLADPFGDDGCPLGSAFLFHPGDGVRINLPAGTYGDSTVRDRFARY